MSSVPSPNLSHLSNETQALFQQLLVEAVEPVEAIREQVNTHMKLLREAAIHAGHVNHGMAESITRSLLALLAGLDQGSSAEEHRLIQAAAHYFVMDDDSAGDFSGWDGLSDDLAVVQAVCDALGKGEQDS